MTEAKLNRELDSWLHDQRNPGIPVDTREAHEAPNPCSIPISSRKERRGSEEEFTNPLCPLWFFKPSAFLLLPLFYSSTMRPELSACKV